MLIAYWQIRNVEEGITVQAHDCLFPELASPTQEAELSVPHVLLSEVNLGYVNTPIQLSSLIRTDSDVRNLLVQFAIMDETGNIYSDTVGIPHISVGFNGYTRHYVEANRPWTPSQSGTYTLTVTVDPDNRFIEQNETDNQETVSIVISDAPAAEFTPLLMGGGQLITQTIASLDGLSTDSYEIDIYQYQYDSFEDVEDSTLQRPIQTADITPINSNQFDFSAARPGLMTLHVWAKSDEGEPLHQPQILHLNYAPPAQPIARNETHYFWYHVEDEDTGGTVSFDFEAVTGSASLLVWTPFDVWSADSSSGGGLPFTARPGQYLVQVRGTSAGTTYTFNITHDRTATSRSALNKQRLSTEQIRRTDFVYPYPQQLDIPLAVEMNAVDPALPKILPTIPITILIVCITLLGRFTITRRTGQAC